MDHFMSEAWSGKWEDINDSEIRRSGKEGESRKRV